MFIGTNSLADSKSPAENTKKTIATKAIVVYNAVFGCPTVRKASRATTLAEL
jgi:hypothetical protein